MSTESKIMGVHLGRFAPYTVGHELVTTAVIEAYGIANSLVMIGSSNAFNIERTPFTFEQRRDLIQAIFPGIEVIPLPDMIPERATFKTDTIQAWRAQLKRVMEGRKEHFIFHGGADEDIAYLRPDFETRVVIDRLTTGKGISATAVREALARGDSESLAGMLNAKILSRTIEFYRANRAALLKS